MIIFDEFPVIRWQCSTEDLLRCHLTVQVPHVSRCCAKIPPVDVGWYSTGDGEMRSDQILHSRSINEVTLRLSWSMGGTSLFRPSWLFNSALSTAIQLCRGTTWNPGELRHSRRRIWSSKWLLAFKERKCENEKCGFMAKASLEYLFEVAEEQNLKSLVVE